MRMLDMTTATVDTAMADTTTHMIMATATAESPRTLTLMAVMATRTAAATRTCTASIFTLPPTQAAP